MMFQLPDEQETPSAEYWPPVNIRVSDEIQRGIRVEARKLQLTLGEYMVRLYAFGKMHSFSPTPAPPTPRARRPVRSPFIVRFPPDIATDMHIDAADRKMKLSPFIEQLFAFGQENHFLAWLESYES
jgi:predicted HicB family RNase H-like nuclease